MNPRHAARDAALRILYFCEIGGAPPVEAIGTFFAEHEPDADEEIRKFTGDIVLGTVSDLDAIDELIKHQSQHWRLERFAVLDRLILRMATWELRHRSDTPHAVVLNEAIELARTYGSDASVAFVNGVLDGIRKTLEGHGAQASGHSENL
jgi:N utilization substance protein B